MNKKITIGSKAYPLLLFDADQIRSIVYTTAVDVIGSELSIDKITIILDYVAEADALVLAGLDFDGIMSSDDYVMAVISAINIRELPFGMPIYYYSNNELQIKAYIKNVERIGEKTYRVNAVSAIGLLDTPKHRGGLYKGIPLSQLLAEVIGQDIPYTVENDVANTQVFGWLPYDSKRKNLHQILFSYGIAVGRNENGDMHFHFLGNDTEKTVPDGRLYVGGSVNYLKAASAVQVMEHSYMALPTDDVVTEYDNSDGSETANNTLIVFRNAPLHDLDTTGTLSVVDSDANWAIISGTGTLIGKKYTHSTKAMVRGAAVGSEKESIATIDSNCTLISVTNSQNVLDRCLSYYSSQKTVKAALVLEGEKAGDLIVGHDPYHEAMSGYIASMDVVVSGIDKANCTVITNYVPTGGGNNFTQAILYTDSGTIDFAALVADKDNDLVQAVLISGGHGGYSGETGTQGTRGGQGTSPQWGTPGDGGAGGQPGEGGYVFAVTFHVSDLASATLQYACGLGGLSDLEGEHTTLGAWSTINGNITPNGVSNIFTGEVFGIAGIEAGQPGGAGSGKDGDGPNVTYGGEIWSAGFQGAYARDPYSDERAWGGYGGGAAVGSNGGDGEDAEAYSGGVSAGVGGDGADGADGADAVRYGGGGNGGHGGGGGGVGGIRYEGEAHGSWYSAQRNGYGGQGGQGGQGGNGAIIVYI